MAITVTDKTAQITLDALDATWNSGKLQFRTGAPPGANAAPTGTLLVEITLPADAFAAASGRTKTKLGTWSGLSVAIGTIGHYRLIASTDTGIATQAEAREEGTVTLTGAGGDLQVDAHPSSIGQTVTVTAYTYSHP